MRIGRTRRHFALAAGTCLVVFAGVGRAGEVVFSDDTFPDASWTAVEVVDGTPNGSFDVSASQQASGGNPDDYRRIIHALDTPTASSILSGHFLALAGFDPGEDGSFESLDMSFDGISEIGNPAGAMGYGALVEQSGVYFSAALTPGAATNGAGWQTLSATGLVAADFAAQGQIGALDLSDAGAPIQIGLFVSSGTFGTPAVNVGGVDNWTATVHTIDPAVPFALLVESDADGSAVQEFFIAEFADLDDLLSQSFLDSGFSNADFTAAFSAGGLAFDGARYYLLLETELNAGSGEEIVIFQYASLDELYAGSPLVGQSSQLDVGAGFDVRAFTHDGSRFHVLLESKDDRSAGSEVFHVAFASFTDLIDANFAPDSGFIQLDVGVLFGIGGLAHDGTSFHLLIESNDDLPAGTEVFWLEFASLADLQAGAAFASDGGFTQVNIGGSYGLRGVTAPEPGLAAMLASGLLVLSARCRRRIRPCRRESGRSWALEQLGELGSVPPIWLDPLPGVARNQGRHDDQTVDALRRQISLEAVATRFGLVGAADRARHLALPLPHEAVHGSPLARKLLPFALTALFAVATPGWAGDGVLEVNHVSIMADGGYPWQPEAGNYRLTSDLVSGNAVGILLENDFVVIDFNGFALVGSAGAATNGVDAGSSPDGHVLRNGSIRGFGGRAVDGMSTCRIENMQILNNQSGGLRLGSTCVVRDNLLSNNGGVALEVTGSGTAYKDNVLADSGASHVFGSGAISQGGNLCDGEACASPPMRRFYLSTDFRRGFLLLLSPACAPGFHFASLWEIADVSHLRYDTTLGRTEADSGEGPPTGEPGWIRTGSPSASSGQGAGLDNCQTWGTDTGPAVFGTTAELSSDWSLMSAPSEFEVWNADTASCAQNTRYWCVQD